jgi:hypothetical protein
MQIVDDKDEGLWVRDIFEKRRKTVKEAESTVLRL